MDRLKALIFNFDGTLANTREAHRLSFNFAFKELNIACHFGEIFFNQRHARALPKRVWLERLAFARGFDRELVEPVLAAQRTHFQDFLDRGEIQIHEDAHSILLKAKDSGCKLAIATMAERQTVERVIDASFGQQSGAIFDAIQCCETTGNAKPNPEVYNAVMETLAESRQDCVAFENSANGLEAATKAGLYTIGVRGNQALPDETEMADLCVPNLALNPMQLMALAGGPKAPSVVAGLASIL